MNSSAKRYFVVILLAFVNFTHILDFMIMMPMSDMLTKKLHITSQQFSLLVSSYGFAALLSAISSLKIVDRFDRKTLLLTSFGLFILATMGCSMVNSFDGLLFMRIAAGFFGGIIGSTVIAMVSDLFEFKERGKAMGFVMLGFSTASVIGVPLGLKLAEGGNWQYPFIMIAGFGALLWTILFFILPNFNKHIHAEKVKPGFMTILKRSMNNRSQRNALLLSFTLVLGHFLTIPFIAMYMVRNVGMPEDHLMRIYLYGGIINLIAGPIVGRLTDKFGPKKIFFILVVLATIPVLLITHLPPVEEWKVLICTGLFFLLAGSRMVPLTTLVSGVVNPEERGSFESLRSTFIQLGSASASLIGGLIVVENANKVENYNYVGYLSVAVCLFCLFYLPRIIPIQQKNG